MSIRILKYFRVPPHIIFRIRRVFIVFVDILKILVPGLIILVYVSLFLNVPVILFSYLSYGLKILIRQVIIFIFSHLIFLYQTILIRLTSFLTLILIYLLIMLLIPLIFAII